MHTKTRLKNWTKRVQVVALLTLLGWISISPPSVSAVELLPPLPGSLVVTITAPTAGSTVTGSVTVSASISPVGVLVGGVQFKLDGVDLGAEDTAAPYAISWGTTGASNGSHTLTAVARDALGLRYVSAPVTVTVFNDTAPPVVSITSPASGATVAGTITVSADASDNVGVTGVQLLVDGAALGAEDTAAPYSVSWNTATTSNGSHTLTVRARDAAGNVSTSTPVTVTVSNAPPAPDTTAPSVAITSPSEGATVSGTITVAADASDNVRVARVVFSVNDRIVAVQETAPYAFAWDTTTLFDGVHTLTAKAWDASGNSASSLVTMTISNGGVEGVVWTSLVNATAMGSSLKKTSGFQEGEDAGAISSQTISLSEGYVRFTALAGRTLTIGLSHDNPGTSSAEIDFGIKLWETNNAWVIENGRAVADVLFGSGSVFRIAVESGVVNYSKDGRVFYRSTVTPTSPLRVDTSIQTLGASVADVVIATGTAPAPDTTPPAATITSPVSGSTVSGRVFVMADAWDNASVAGVRFFVDGLAMETEDTKRPYGVGWDTTTVADGPHALTTVARDAAGNTTTSTTVSVTVSNAAPPPPPIVTRVEETAPAIVYSGGWIPDSTYGPWSGGTATYTVEAGAQARFTFNGTGVSWIGYRGRYGGVVRVFLDGVFVAEVDAYSATEEVSVAVYSATGLTPGDHSLMVELTGARNPSAINSEMAVDAFDVSH